MSRVGRKPIDIPGGVKVDVQGKKVKVESKGIGCLLTMIFGSSSFARRMVLPMVPVNRLKLEELLEMEIAYSLPGNR